MQQNRLDAGLYDEARYLRDIGARLGWSDDFAYVVHRGLIVHDLLHVLGGYGPDVGGELGVVGFTHGQVPNIGTRSLMFFLPFMRTGASRRRLRQQWTEAEQRGKRGKRGKILMAQPYEELMQRPLVELRRELDIVAFDEAHPDGRLYLGYQFGKKEHRELHEAIPPYTYEPDHAGTTA